MWLLRLKELVLHRMDVLLALIEERRDGFRDGP